HSPGTTNDHPRGCSKRLSSKAAGESKPEAYLSSPARPRAAKTARFPRGYVEDFDEPRTTHGNRRVLARWGWAGDKSDFFSILLGSFHTVQNFAHFFRQHGRRKRLLQKPGQVAHAALVKHRMVRIPRHVEHFDLWSNDQNLLRDFRPAHLRHDDIRQQQM